MQQHSPNQIRVGYKSGARVPLACVQCRTRHVRCDAVNPTCSRCQKEGKYCLYTKSRRGGRCRAGPTRIMVDAPRSDVVQPANQVQSRDTALIVPDLDMNHTWDSDGGILTSLSVSDDPDYLSGTAGTTDQTLVLYYTFFHDAHPCALPQQHMRQKIEENPESVQLLVLVMSFIGSLYAPSVSSKPFEERLRTELSKIQPRLTGFRVQALLLYSIAVYWNNETERALVLLDDAIRTAIGLGMHLCEFANLQGNGDPILEECWRRTWWQIYVNDMQFAASSYAPTFTTSGVLATVELPCEEHEYVSGNIPHPRKLVDYENREFLNGNDADGVANFSSFAHLIGLTRSLDLALTGASRTDEESAIRLCKDVDAVITGWFSFLPRAKRELVGSDRTVDELLFGANMLIHTCIVDLHRPLSALAYSTVEAVSRCAPPPPPEHLSPARVRESHMHTTKILHAIEKITELLTLPTCLALHTPFTICMVGTTTIAHLSACKYVLKGRSLNMARERIRTSMGTLKSFEENWVLGGRTRREVGIVAREILGLEDSERSLVTDDALARITSDVAHFPDSDFGSLFDNIFF